VKHGTCLFCVIALALTTGDASAHHSFAPFDMDKRATLIGTLTKVDWRNPHIEISIDVKSDQGRVEPWVIEGGPPARFKDYGVSKDSFARAIGLMVTVEAEVQAGVALRQETVVELRDDEAGDDADDGEHGLTSRRAQEDGALGDAGGAAVDQQQTVEGQGYGRSQQDVVEGPPFAPANHAATGSPPRAGCGRRGRS